MSYMNEANAIADELRRAPRPPACHGGGRDAPTPRALEVLAYMREFYSANDQLPPKAKIAEHFGWTSPNAAQDYVGALMRHGLLERNAVGKLRFARPAAKDGAA